jgi:biotin carboxylase
MVLGGSAFGKSELEIEKFVDNEEVVWVDLRGCNSSKTTLSV